MPSIGSTAHAQVLKEAVFALDLRAAFPENQLYTHRYDNWIRIYSIVVDCSLEEAHAAISLHHSEWQKLLAAVSEWFKTICSFENKFMSMSADWLQRDRRVQSFTAYTELHFHLTTAEAIAYLRDTHGRLCLNCDG